MRLLLLFFFCFGMMAASATIQAEGTSPQTNAQTSQERLLSKKMKKLSAKKKKRLQRKLVRLEKKMQRKKSPGFWSIFSGLGSLALIAVAIGASFALSSTGALLGLIGAGVLGIAALFFGFRAKNNGQGIGGWIGIIFGGLSLIAVLAMLIGAAVG